MQSKPRFRVAVAGMDLRDVRLIEIVFKHSQYNRYEFVLVNSIAPGELDLLIVNAHDFEGQAAISKLRESNTVVPVIAAVPRGESSGSRHAISIDRLTLQLLPIMNRVVELELLSKDSSAAPREPAPASTPVPTNSQRPIISTPTYTGPERRSAERLKTSIESKSEVQPKVQSLAASTYTASTTAETGSLIAPQATPQATPRPNLVAIPGSKAAGKALRVLVVDDSPTVRQQLGGALEKMGFIVELAATAADALTRFEKSHFDLALVDVIMPEIDGYKLTKELKRDKKRRGMPVIILTSKSSPFDLARGALAGCDSFLTKPVPLMDLQNAIVKHLRKSLAIDDLSGLLKLYAPKKPTEAQKPALKAENQ